MQSIALFLQLTLEKNIASTIIWLSYQSIGYPTIVIFSVCSPLYNLVLIMCVCVYLVLKTIIYADRQSFWLKNHTTLTELYWNNFRWTMNESQRHIWLFRSRKNIKSNLILLWFGLKNVQGNRCKSQPTLHFSSIASPISWIEWNFSQNLTTWLYLLQTALSFSLSFWLAKSIRMEWNQNKMFYKKCLLSPLLLKFDCF